MSALAYPAPPLLPDAEQVVTAYLRGVAAVTAIAAGRVYTVFPAQAGNEPLVVVQRIGGTPPFSQPLVLDAAQLQLDVYGGPKKTAHDLAATIRSVLCALESQHVGVAGVVFGAFRYLPDETFNPPRPRYLLDVTVTVRAPIALGAREPHRPEPVGPVLARKGEADGS